MAMPIMHSLTVQLPKHAVEVLQDAGMQPINKRVNPFFLKRTFGPLVFVG